MQEIWKDVTGYEGMYQVSNLGKVKSLARIIDSNKGFKTKLKSRILKPSLTTYGYHHYGLYTLGKMKSYKAHVLIASHFIPNPGNKRNINHKNGIKTDNRLENLEWCTCKENIQHAYDNGQMTSVWKGVKVGKKAIKIRQYSLNGKFIRTYDSMCKAEKETGVGRANISLCINKNHYSKTAGGFIWKAV